MKMLITLSFRIRRTLSVIVSILREVFDESAYARFLERRQLRTSRDAYAQFLSESRQQRERRPRCC